MHHRNWIISCILFERSQYFFVFSDRLFPSISPEPRPQGPLGSDKCMFSAVCFYFEATALYPSVQDLPPNSRKPSHQSVHRPCRSLQAGGLRVSELNLTFPWHPSSPFTRLNLKIEVGVFSRAPETVRRMKGCDFMFFHAGKSTCICTPASSSAVVCLANTIIQVSETQAKCQHIYFSSRFFAPYKFGRTK